MAQRMQAYANFKYFAVTSPAPFVAHVEISRAEKLNAFVEPMWLEMGAVFRQLSADPDVRAVVLSGAGDRGFTAGLDVMAASEGAMLGAKDGPQDVSRAATALRRHIYEFQDSVGSVEKCEKRELCPFPSSPPPPPYLSSDVVARDRAVKEGHRFLVVPRSRNESEESLLTPRPST